MKALYHTDSGRTLKYKSVGRNKRYSRMVLAVACATVAISTFPAEETLMLLRHHIDKQLPYKSRS